MTDDINYTSTYVINQIEVFIYKICYAYKVERCWLIGCVSYDLYL